MKPAPAEQVLRLCPGRVYGWAGWLALALAVALGGCLPQDQDDSDWQVHLPGSESVPPPPEEILARVNGAVITEGMLQLYARSRHTQHPAGNPPAHSALLEELINLVLLAQAAQDSGLHTHSAAADQLRFHSANLLADAQLRQLRSQSRIDDQQLRADHRALHPGGTLTEYKVRHILVADRTLAQRLIDQLQSGADFQVLAQQHSIGPSAPYGGGLEWFKADAVLPEFAAAVNALTPGAMTQAPVQTTYGWHVIQLEDRRQVPAPAFESMRDQLQQQRLEQELEQAIDSLRSRADVQIIRP